MIRGSFRGYNGIITRGLENLFNELKATSKRDSKRDSEIDLKKNLWRIRSHFYLYP